MVAAEDSVFALWESGKNPLRFETLEVTAMEQKISAEKVKSYEEVRTYQRILYRQR